MRAGLPVALLQSVTCLLPLTTTAAMTCKNATGTGVGAGAVTQTGTGTGGTWTSAAAGQEGWR